MHDDITFVRLTEIDASQILDHMTDPRVAEHMPLLNSKWTMDMVTDFVASKEECWHKDGLGYWAILLNGKYVGWGGLQSEEGEWDFGLVLRPEIFGLGPRITRRVIEFAFADDRIQLVKFLVPPSRKNLSAFDRLGARYVGEIDCNNTSFLKYELRTV
ncbi:hypothetical protein GCM10007853_21000 [Algimonas ampicilliniresistens]|uniref:N-acetyltransferase domain-containing protein n=1 Tax=Algimonas ampicilliniresistens TaxID=1298735 RepID=A0ABQ5V9L3_9PROT|nr:GNAT family protein [Algimonas ampicilliniresistens]GLQ24226.1 hypothetical protein GCM10007853_21000 [Algimonas ampicilliniresistens]